MARYILYLDHISDLNQTITKAKMNGYDTVATNIVQMEQREFYNQPLAAKHINFTRSDLILDDWIHILKLSETIDCDSSDENIRKISEKTLLQELCLAQHLGQNSGLFSFKLKSGNCANLARIFNSIIGTLLIEVPVSSQQQLTEKYRRDIDDKPTLNDDPWNWWNNLRTYADSNRKIILGLELTEKIPTREEIFRWFGEPVEYLIIPSRIFVLNSAGYPVLSKLLQEIIVIFIRLNVSFMVKANAEDKNLKYYAEYLAHLHRQFYKNDSMNGFEDRLELPLQPLYDNLDSYTYEIFEQDPIKYHAYQNAIEMALIDTVVYEEIQSKIVVIMVVGAGRGPLVRAILNASKKTGIKTKIYVVEKNPNAVITLKALSGEIWLNENIEVISSDIRDFQPVEKADILVSELLGSFGDNELSPECLHAAQKHLKADGISIPCKSTSYISPTMSSRIYNNVRFFTLPKTQRNITVDYGLQSENYYGVYLKNIYHLDEPKSLFEFVHPNFEKNIDFTRFKTLNFTAKIDCVLHGFAGYFDTVLYKEITLSIHPMNHTPGLVSWFAIFFPISDPQQIKAGDEIEVNFWRCEDNRKVWYEWNTSAPKQTHIHNLRGRACSTLK